MAVERYTTTRERRRARRFQQHPYLPRPPGARHRRAGITHGPIQGPVVGLGNVGGYGRVINLHPGQTPAQEQVLVLQYLQLLSEAQTAVAATTQVQSPQERVDIPHNIQVFAVTHYAAQNGNGRPLSVVMFREFSILTTNSGTLAP
ncbi:hypothetical protein AB1N83_010651 [Pleurotus pulmonarius]